VRNKRAAIISWCLFDWGLTPFHTVINTFVFSIYFSRVVYGDEVGGSAAWSYAASAAGLLVAVLSPLTGAIADRAGHLKRWIGVLLVLNLVPTALLWFCRPHAPGHSDVALTLSLIVAATIGGELVLTFYNALLPRLAPPGKLGRLSGLGWGMGYLGGLVALGITLVALALPDQPWFGIPKTDGMNLRATGPLIALWTCVFGWPLFVFVRDESRPPISLIAACRTGFTQLRGSLAKLPQQKPLFWFLIASGLYRDGLNTLFAVGGQYAAGTFHMSFQQIMEFGIGINIAAGLGCLGFGWLDDKIGPQRTIQIALVGILLTGTELTLITQKIWFMPVALCLGIFIGPAQSAGRSLMARLAPPEMVTEMFGLYQFAGRSISFLGPLAFALTISVFHNQRLGIATILLFIFGGLVLMRKVRLSPHFSMTEHEAIISDS
jgi:UMF1 family MFS transporter